MEVKKIEVGKQLKPWIARKFIIRKHLFEWVIRARVKRVVRESEIGGVELLVKRIREKIRIGEIGEKRIFLRGLKSELLIDFGK